MQPDDELCLCFHVSWRKVINYSRINKVRLPSQISECFGAGTGCGWCRPFLRRIVEQVADSPPDSDGLEQWLAERSPNKSRYSSDRQAYKADKNRHDSPPPSDPVA